MAVAVAEDSHSGGVPWTVGRERPRALGRAGGGHGVAPRGAKEGHRQTPNWQVPPVHLVPSATGEKVQPLAGRHSSLVQGLASLQVLA